ncbi:MULTISPECIES: hypothetical protein [Pasteurellaceae]|uniref:Uncharacterized protein n=1 Tax=Pasteurella atlantica TaxID=2827233 RepID=A0AAW8CKU4_9PAST|nr:hypothetical protein [Pasteurella atlantica]MBR0573007.1 hypothetical protein [Pasteurella atlantica]MDP8038866.1 hypothetical protein [Pasteurella atlantica]MDP8041025.1 hypothetical protein [Pasteurella atlantica]MDP8043161.1 hypothetical protein [Pasteurella atlantica]MDP8045247.1 hypothetical protein [Pasteurella atlantica]
MKKLVILFIGIVSFLPGYVQAKTCSIIVYSGTSLKMAKKTVLVAKKYKHFDNVTILKNNGKYLVSVANVNKVLSDGILEEWKEEKIIPQNSFCLIKKYTRSNSKTTTKKIAPVMQVKRKLSKSDKSNVCDVIIHSSKSLQTTRDEVRKYKNFNNVTILKSKQGWFLVSVANLNKQASEQILNEWKAQGKIPNDSYCSSVRYPLFENSPYNKRIIKTKKEPIFQTDKNVVKTENKNETVQRQEKKVIERSNVDVVSEAELSIFEFNKKIAKYQKNKLNFIDSYNKTNNALKLTLQSPTQDNLSQYERLLQGLFVIEKVLIESYNSVVNDYKINMEYFNKIKGVDKLPSFLKSEQKNIEMISNKISKMNTRLCQNKSFNCN